MEGGSGGGGARPAGTLAAVAVTLVESGERVRSGRPLTVAGRNVTGGGAVQGQRNPVSHQRPEGTRDGPRAQ
jgi:hypothetical protein